ncbi:MAG: hypothetical protein AVDCRST_MAG93-308, partial [uncultured Chloroflexia bacterium]
MLVVLGTQEDAGNGSAALKAFDVALRSFYPNPLVGSRKERVLLLLPVQRTPQDTDHIDRKAAKVWFCSYFIRSVLPTIIVHNLVVIDRIFKYRPQ